MWRDIWESVGETVSNRWLLTTLTPVLVFCLGWILLVADTIGYTAALTIWRSYGPGIQVLLILTLVALVVFIAFLLEALSLPIARLYEGYWGGLPLLSRLGHRLTERQRVRFQRLEKQWQTLAEEGKTDGLEFAYLDNTLANYPADPDKIMPTQLGDVLRAVEEYPKLRYDLNIAVSWTRLYFCLPEEFRALLGGARSSMDALLRVSLLSTILWVTGEVYVLAARQWITALILLAIVVLARLTYLGAVQAAGLYGDLVRTAYDLHRFDLYEALHWPLPQSPTEEIPAVLGGQIRLGERLTGFIDRGYMPQGVRYTHAKSVDKEQRIVTWLNKLLRLFGRAFGQVSSDE